MSISSHIVDALRSATETDRLFMHYQPIVDSQSTKTIGYEALARIRSPKGEVRHLSAFLHGMASSPLLWDLDRRAVRHTLDALKEIREVLGTSDLFVSSNVSGISLSQPDVVTTMLDMADERGLSSRDIVIEIDGESALEAGTAGLSALERLIEVGARVILDGFGTNTSTLAHLEALPLSGIKLNRSRVPELDDAQTQALIVKATQRASDRGQLLFASGVETQTQLDQLREYGFEGVQGWLFAGAIPLQDNLLIAQAEQSQGEQSNAG